MVFTRMQMTLSRDVWAFPVYANNVSDTDPVIDFNPTNAFTQALTVRPRTVGVSPARNF